MSAPWYDEEKVAIKGSVVLAKWNRERAAAKALAAKNPSRIYAGAKLNRLTADWNALNTSADSEILTSVRALRARARQMVRDDGHAKNSVRIVQNNVVGNGIGMQAQVSSARGKLQEKINTQIETAWAKWIKADTCHVAGKLGMTEILRLVMAQQVEAGEILIRKIRKPFGNGKIPLALELIECDRLMDQYQNAKAPNGNVIRMGVEQDQWGRPVAYWLHPTHPGDYTFTSFVPSKFVRVPAEDIIHPFIIDRWPQTRGVSWFHAVLKKMHDMAGYTEAEIVAARASANIVGAITTPELLPGNDEKNDEQVVDVEPGTWKRLLPGEDLKAFIPSRPNTGLEPFMRYMLREMAAGIGVSYESLSRDYSQSNYSSSRLSLLDDRDLWRVLQGWLVRGVLHNIYCEFLEAAVLCGELNFPDYSSNEEKYQAVRFKPRGWGWIDPTKEVGAFQKAVRSGYMTVSDVIAQTGGGADAEDTFKARRQELDMMEELGLVFDTDPAKVKLTKENPATAIDPSEEDPPSEAGEDEKPDDESAAE